MEIYNEVITDLLNTSNTNLKINERNGEIYVGGLTEEVVCSAEHIMHLMNQGHANRHVGSTKMNERSSRSHTIFRIVIESREVSFSDTCARISTNGAVLVAQLNLVDLAGSERADQTGAEAQRLKEGGHINKSLLYLGTVISKLSEGVTQATGHIPYRDSKLTRILQNSLGGNTRTAIVCTVTPAAAFVEETVSTLKFASRAKSIKNNAIVNEIMSDDALLKRYRKEINELKRQKDMLESGVHVEELKKEKNMLAEEVKRRAQELREKEEKIQELTKLICVSSTAEAPAAPPTKEEKIKALRRGTWCPGTRKSTFMRRSIEPLPKRKHVEVEAATADPDQSTNESFFKNPESEKQTRETEEFLQEELTVLRSVRLPSWIKNRLMHSLVGG